MVTTGKGIAEQIRADLDAGLWAPGTALRQEELAQRYGASRMPVREALLQLHAEGLVAMHPNRGAVVAELGARDVAEIFDLRLQIESYLLAQALPGHDAKTLAGLAAVQQELEAENSRAGWLDGDRRFHARLYEPAAKPRALGIAANLRAQVERHGLHTLTPASRKAEWAQEHRALIAAVKTKNLAAGLAALAGHLAHTRDAVLRSLPAAAAR
jgi:DNA-binding GntR family transcriptional regulator